MRSWFLLVTVEVEGFGPMHVGVDDDRVFVLAGTHGASGGLLSRIVATAGEVAATAEVPSIAFGLAVAGGERDWILVAGVGGG